MAILGVAAFQLSLLYGLLGRVVLPDDLLARQSVICRRCATLEKEGNAIIWVISAAMASTIAARNRGPAEMVIASWLGSIGGMTRAS